MGVSTAPVAEIDRMSAEIAKLKERLDILEAPSGTQTAQAVKLLTALVTDIQAQLDAWVLARWTNAQVTTEINSRIAATFAAPASFASTLGVTGAFYNPAGYAFDITYTRRTAWLGNDGRLGYASSSRDGKTSIRPADEVALLALLDVGIFDFMYRAEIRRRTSKRINDGEDYMPARELGLMAQDLDAAGLGFFVYHDEAGEPEGVEYGMLTVALLAIARGQRDEIAALRADVADLKKSIG